MTARDVDPRVGQVIADRYRIVRRLGQGGMGTVYEALHLQLRARRAVKFVRMDGGNPRDAMARFQREALAAGGLQHENIALVFDVGLDDGGVPYLVMEYLEGKSLSALLAEDGPLPVLRAVDIAIQVCTGLEAVHAQGVVHRDLKPDNLFVCRRVDGRDLVKILDFGIAKLDGGEGTVTQTGTAIGTPSYMAPEQARGLKDLDGRVDVHAVGVILYELLSGAKPHPGDNYNAILTHILMDAPEPLASRRAGLPAGLSEVIHRAMARRADDRFPTARALSEALMPFAGAAVSAFAVGGMLAVAGPLGETRPAPVEGAKAPDADEAFTVPLARAPGAEAVPPASPAQGRATSRRGLRVAALLAIGAGVAGVSVAAWAWRSKAPSGPDPALSGSTAASVPSDSSPVGDAGAPAAQTPELPSTAASAGSKPVSGPIATGRPSGQRPDKPKGSAEAGRTPPPPPSTATVTQKPGAAIGENPFK